MIVDAMVKSISGSGVSMMIDGCGSQSRKLQNSTVAPEESTEVATRRAQSDGTDKAVQCTATVSLKNVETATVEFGGTVSVLVKMKELGIVGTKDADSGSGSMSLLKKGSTYTVLSKDGAEMPFMMWDDEADKEEGTDFILRPEAESSPPTLEEVLTSTASLPPWYGLPGAQVQELRWDTNNDNSTFLIKFITMGKVSDFSHPLVDSYMLFGDIVCTDSPGLSECAAVIDKVTVDMKYAGTTHTIDELTIDGEADSEIKFPVIRLLLGVDEGQAMFRKIMADGLASLGFGTRISETAYATSMTFDFDFSKPWVLPKEAVIDKVQLVIRREVLTPIQFQMIVLATESDMSKARGSTVV
jgi:hypothetical protein